MSCAIKIITNNKKAYHDYFIYDTYEAGIELMGSEVKSVRNGGVSILDGFAYVKNGEVFVKNIYIKPYEKTSSYVPDSRRDRKLLLHSYEIDKIAKKVVVKGFSLLPLKVYLKHGLVKVEIGIGQGKKLYDKRDVLAEKAMKRNLERELKNR